MMKCVGNPFGVCTLLVLAKREIQELLSIGEALKAVEYAFKLEAKGRVIMPLKLYLNTPNGWGNFRALPALLRSRRKGERRIETTGRRQGPIRG